MSTLTDMPTVVIMAFLFCVIFLIIIFNLSKRFSTHYANNYPNGKPLGEKTKRIFKDKRKRNNPNDEDVGPGTDRCHFCGYKREPNERTPFALALLEKEKKICGDCHLFV